MDGIDTNPLLRPFPHLMKRCVYIIFILLFIHANLPAQTSRSVCKVTVNEKPYIISPERDSLTKGDFIKARLLKVPGNKYRIVSFQVTIVRYGFGFIVYGPNYGVHDYARAFLKLEPGDKVRVECIQVTDKAGTKDVLQDRTFYIIAGPQKATSDSLR